MKQYNVPVLVTINKFGSDTEEEIEYIRDLCRENNVKCSMSEVFIKGGEGGIELANQLVDTIENEISNYEPLYDEKLPIKEKIETICKKIYGANGVIYLEEAEKQIKRLEELGLDKMPVCMAKTQYSLSDDAKKLGRPENFEVTVREVKVSNGAGFIVVITGKILTMPGLPKVPAAERIDVLPDGTLDGIF
jgi:formate--tetrahydrofolate ligase